MKRNKDGEVGVKTEILGERKGERDKEHWCLTGRGHAGAVSSRVCIDRRLALRWWAALVPNFREVSGQTRVGEQSKLRAATAHRKRAAAAERVFLPAVS